MKRTFSHGLSLCTVALLLTSCADEEQEQLLLQLQNDMATANTTIDSLTYSLDDSHLLLDGMRAQVDSMQQVNDNMLESVQKLNKEMRRWSKIAGERQKKVEEQNRIINEMKNEKRIDRRAIARLRVEADSLNGELLTTHTSIRRQSDHIRNLEMNLAQTRDKAETLAAAQHSVHLYAASEKYLKDNGYLQSSRPFGGGFRKQFKLIKKISSHPLMRALRVDKITLAALAATLRIYQDPAMATERIPLLRLLSTPLAVLQERAESIAGLLEGATGLESAEPLLDTTYLGGGSVPTQEIETWTVAITPRGISLDVLARQLRNCSPAIMGRVHQGRLVLDLRSVFPDQDAQLVEGLIQTLS